MILTALAERGDTRRNLRHVEAVLNGYNRKIGGLRLLARGVSPDVTAPLKIEIHRLETPKQRVGQLLTAFPMFVVFAVFLGGFYVATDCTAGERERGSLEPLLLTRAHRFELAVGKWLAAVTVAGAGGLASIAAMAIGLPMLPADKLGVEVGFVAGDIGWMVTGAVFMGFASAGLQMLVATFARNFREAQSYTSIIMLVPVIPVLLSGLEAQHAELWMMFMPFFGQQMLLMDVMGGFPVPWFFHVVAAGVSCYSGCSWWGRRGGRLAARKS